MSNEFTIEWWLNRVNEASEAFANETQSKADEFFLKNKESYLAPIIIDNLGRDSAEKLADLISVLTRG